MQDSHGEVTALLSELNLGSKDALTKLMPIVYRELRRVAGNCMRDERPGHTLQPTALVHETFLRLVDQDRADWRNRAQFVGVAAQFMRRLLGGPLPRTPRSETRHPRHPERRDTPTGRGRRPTEEILAVDEILERLAELDPQQARIVDLRYFGGLSVEETAEAMEISPRTVKRDWAMAEAWMKTQLDGGSP